MVPKEKLRNFAASLAFVSAGMQMLNCLKDFHAGDRGGGIFSLIAALLSLAAGYVILRERYKTR